MKQPFKIKNLLSPRTYQNRLKMKGICHLLGYQLLMGKSFHEAAKNKHRICYHLGYNIKRLTIKGCFIRLCNSF